MFAMNKTNQTAHKTWQDNFWSNVQLSLVLFSLSRSANNLSLINVALILKLVHKSTGF